MKNFTLSVITILLCIPFCYSQTIIRSQSFDSASTDNLGYTVSSGTYVQVSNTTFASSPNSLRFGSNGSTGINSEISFNNIDISFYTDITVTVSFSSIGVDSGEDLFLDISYNNGSSYTTTQLIDGDGGESINWGSNDSDAQSVNTNPYTFNVPNGNNQLKIRLRATSIDNGEYFYIDDVIVEGTVAISAPEIQVTGNNSEISSGDTSPSLSDDTNFGTVNIGSSRVKTFIINNIGTQDLNISNITLSNTTDFALTGTTFSSPIAPGYSTTFSIRYYATAATTHSSSVTITNNDANESSYTFDIQSTGANVSYAKVTDNTDDWEVQNITTNSALNNPYEITYGPDDYLWITERQGRKLVKVSPDDGVNTVITMIDLSSVVYQTAGQDGLMGFAIHPDLYTDINTSNNYVYLAYTYNSNGRKLRIERYTYNAGTGLINSGSAYTLIEGIEASNDHNSGRLIFGPDSKLYYTIGDQGANQFGNACNEIRSQYLPTSPSDYSDYKGKVLRLNLDGSIPSDNPTLAGVKSHVYTYGHRNAQGIIFGSNGLLYSSEHGPKTDDEINIISSGNNYGWPLVSGYQDGTSYYEYCNWSSVSNCSSVSDGNTDHSCLTGATVTLETSAPTITEPMKTFGTLSENDTPGYDFTPGWLTWPTVGPSSIDIYEGTQIPNWDKSLIIPTLKKGTIFRAKLSEDGLNVVGDYEVFHTSNDRYRDIAMDPDGVTFYAITDKSGTTSGPSGTTPLPIANPGVVMKFKYIGAQPSPTTTYYVDADGDTFGDNADAGTEYGSDPGAGYSLNNTDCNDSDANINPDTIWYADTDGDGYGDSADSLAQCTQPAGYILDNTDCDDTDANINPDTIWYADTDGDGFGDSTDSLTQCTQPAGYVLDNTDCDNADANINPNTIWYADTDGDGYGDSADSLTQCTQPAGYVLDNTDCDDTDANINPDTIWYADGDGDGFGDSTDSLTQCTQPAGYVLDNTDCDDTDANINPDTIWYADGDGDGFGDSADSLTQCAQPVGYVLDNTDCDDTDANINPDTIWYADGDGDGYGDSTNSLTQCEQPVGYVLNNSDCDDADGNINPDTIWYADTDGDGFGDSVGSLTQCAQPASYVLDNTDCDDTDANINPDTIWYADGDGDGFGDSTDSLTQCTQPAGYILDNTDCDDTDANINSDTIWYADTDGDGFGDSADSLTQCTQPAGYVLDNTDCDDTDANINPDTIWYADIDGDGFGDSVGSLTQCAQPVGYVLDNTDCDDNDDSINPGTSEIIGNGKNDDCNPATLDGTLGIGDDINLSKISVTPNPFTSKLTINLPQNFNNDEFIVKVFDLNGRLVFDETIKSIGGTISIYKLNVLEQAPYLLKIINKETDESIVKRLIKY